MACQILLWNPWILSFGVCVTTLILFKYTFNIYYLKNIFELKILWSFEAANLKALHSEHATFIRSGA